MKYDVKFSCGHEETVELFGKYADRERKIDYYKNYGICSACYREQKAIEYSIGCEEKEMSYKEYKTNYSECKTKPGSYDGINKTIIVYVPKGKEKYRHIYVACRETGDRITEVSTIEEGLKTIKEYEKNDKAEDIYTEGFYDLIDENRKSVL